VVFFEVHLQGIGDLFLCSAGGALEEGGVFFFDDLGVWLSTGRAQDVGGCVLFDFLVDEERTDFSSEDEALSFCCPWCCEFFEQVLEEVLDVSSESVDDFFEVGDDCLISLDKPFRVWDFKALGFHKGFWELFDSLLKHMFVRVHNKKDLRKLFKVCEKGFMQNSKMESIKNI